MIHLIQVDRDGIMSFACDEVELFTTQGATRDIFKKFADDTKCPYCAKILTEKNSRVARPR